MPLNRLTSETTPQGAISYAYDNASRRTSATVTGQPSACYSYDNANRLTGIGQGTCPTSTNVVGFTYDNASRRQTMTLPNGIVLTYGYDNDSRISGLTYKLGTNTVGNLTYQYDAAGRRTQLGGSLAASGFPTAVSSATYDVANELTSWAGSTIAYDANGNMVGDGVHTYTWNARNQLSMIDSGTTASFAYDPLGRRTNKTVLGSATGFLYNGANATQELAGGTVSANVLNGGLDEFFTRTDGTGSVVPLTDALGSVLALTNSSGTIQTQYTYDPFGNTSAVGTASNNPSQYTGRENDGTGLYYYRARYYDPAIGRFISEDPIGFAGGINKYAYVDNDPVDFTDPLGLSRDCGKPKCFAQLKYRQVNDKWARRFHRNHAFWYVQGSDGKQLIISAGPNPPDGGNQMLNIWPPNPNTQTGVDNVSAGTAWNSGLSEANCPGVDAMIAAAVAWPQDTIPYHPVGGPNSDTAAHYLGTQGGFNPPAPPGMTGWNTPLPPLGHH